MEKVSTVTAIYKTSAPKTFLWGSEYPFNQII